MKNFLLFCYFFTITFSLGKSPLFCVEPLNLPPIQTPLVQKEPQLIINNRPLAKINGKVISLIDLVKSMDLDLFSYKPDFTFSVIEKYQFYASRWEMTLKEMIADELILLDAEKKEIKVSDGDVHEELAKRFGPNIMRTLEKIHLEYEEAQNIIRTELMIRELLGMKVHAKAMQIVTPQVIKEAYIKYLADNPVEEKATYQVLSIRSQEKTLSEEFAEKAFSFLKIEGKSLEDVSHILTGQQEEEVTISVSKDICMEITKLSKQHRDAILPLSPNTFSKPLAQVSRYDNSTVFRIFYLKDRKQELPSSFLELQEDLRNKLFFQEFTKEKESYVKTLKKQFSYDIHDPIFTLPDNYQPFLLL